MVAGEPWYVYMLLCDEKTFYVGITPDLIHRLKQHREINSFFTKKFSDIELVYQEEHFDRQSAELREKLFKGCSNAKKKALIIGDIATLERLSKAVSLLKPSQG